MPHFDNAEGGNHDTRFCYIGERRLRVLERAMPEDVFILGVDSHTALVLDLERGGASVFGLGGVTVRVAGRSHVFPSGTETTIEALAVAAREVSRQPMGDLERGRPTGARPTGAPETGDAAPSASFAGPLRDEVAQLEGAFVDALAGRDPRAAVGALLALDATLERRVGVSEDSPDLQAARATLRSLIVRLGDLARAGARDPREVVEPYVTALLELRGRARDARDWAAADLVRDRLTAAGVEVRDDATGSSWVLRADGGGAGDNGG